MVLVAITVAVGVLAGWLRGGRVRNLGAVHLRSPWLALLAVAAQLALALALSRSGVATVVLVLSQAAVIAFAIRNWLVPGAFLIAGGSALNTAVIIANRGMPVSRQALLRAGQHPLAISDRTHRLLEPSDALPWLADVIALPALGQVISVGDVVLAAGLGLLVATGMQRRHRPPGRRSARSSPLASPLASPLGGDPGDGGAQTLRQ